MQSSLRNTSNNGMAIIFMMKKQEYLMYTQEKEISNRSMFSLVLTPLQILLVGIATSVLYLLLELIQITMYMCSIIYVSAASLFLGSRGTAKRELWIICSKSTIYSTLVSLPSKTLQCLNQYFKRLLQR